MNSTFVNHIMSKNVLTVDKSTSLQEAAQNMKKSNIGCVIVTEDTMKLKLLSFLHYIR